MGNDDLSARAEELRAETAALNALLGAYASKNDVAESLEQERQRTKDLVRQRDRSNLIFFAVVVLAMVVLSGGVLYNRAIADDAAHAVRQVEQDRVERSRGSCIQFNVNQHNTREAIVQGLVETFRPLTTPDKLGQLEFFAASLRANVEILLPYRDCSDAGVEAFLKEPPQDPAAVGP